ncbi:MAG: LysM peptidoglycan-binding domain-containing protein [Deltaproteobacteria bacterium]|nr:LysM peptidoglycan-binding domain-containing protein [Deltaproteobacteria bacterium]
MKKNTHLTTITLFCALLVGCALPLTKKSPERISEEYLRMGEAYEQEGEWVGALKQYTLALTVNPSGQETRKRLERVKREIKEKARQHYETGLELYREGIYGRAHREFLNALRLRPDYPEVIKILTTRERAQVKRYVIHIIRSGETLSRVAMQYYGDMKNTPIIAKYNDITDATRLYPGQEIKVPEIVGQTFLAEEKNVETAETKTTYTLEAGGTFESKEQEYQDQGAIYRDHGIDLFGKKQYEEAIVAFNKALKADPQDKLVLEYAYKSHFASAVDLYEKEDLLKARDEFQKSLQYKEDCCECIEYIGKIEESYKDTHYKMGIEYFGKEQLNEAIREWEMVQAMDPNYKRVNDLIEKAETILKNIERLKQDLEEEGVEETE